MSLNRQRNIAKQLGDESYAILHYFRDIIDGNVESPREAWYEVVNLQSQESVQSTINYVLGHILVAWVEREGLEVVDEVVSSIAKDLTYGTSLSRVFSELSADQLAEIFDSLIRNLNEELFEVIQRIELVNSWARQDPKGVLARAETLPATELRQTLEWSAVRQWANINPRELLDELELVPLVHRKFAMSSAIRVLTRKSPRDATQFVENEVDFESQLFLATSLVREWCKHDAEATKDWVYKFAENNPLRNALMRPLAIALVVTHPRDAFQIALEQPIEELDSTLGRSSVFEASILSLIASVDLELAIELLPKVRDMGNNKMSAYSTVGVSLIEKGETEQAFDLAKQLSDEVQTQYFQSIASSWSLRDAQGLLQSFDDFPTDFIKSKMADSLRVLNKYTKVYSTEEIQGLEKYLSGKDSEK